MDPKEDLNDESSRTELSVCEKSCESHCACKNIEDTFTGISSNIIALSQIKSTYSLTVTDKINTSSSKVGSSSRSFLLKRDYIISPS